MTGLNANKGFVNRGDPSADDFTQAQLTTDGSWHDLDLSAIVPAGAIAVLLRLAVKDDAVDSWIEFRKKGNSNAICSAIISTQVINIHNQGVLIVACDANRKIQYLAANTAFTAISIDILGWWR